VVKAASSAMLALLASRQFYLIDLFEFQFASGNVLYFCGGDRNIVANGITYLSGGTSGPYFVRKGAKSKCNQKIGLKVNPLEFDVLPGQAMIGSTNTISILSLKDVIIIADIFNFGGAPLLQAVRNGDFDGATFTLQRAVMPMGGYGNTSAGTILMFQGRVGQISQSRGYAHFTINSYEELLTQPIPRNIYEAGCINTLYDFSCTLNPLNFMQTASVAAGSTINNVNVNGLTQATGYYNMGKAIFLTGVLAGQARAIKSWTAGTPGTLSFVWPLAQVPGIGDTLQVFAGCDKQESTCQNNFNNLQHFRGFPFIPSPTIAI